MSFKKINPLELHENAARLISEDWMLITAGNAEKWNTMTASWGGMGFMWNKNVCYIFIRPIRYTYEFVEKNDMLTLSFYENKYRKQLSLCGSTSGRNTDKAKETGFTPIIKNDTVYFEEARLVLVCKKLYYDDIKEKNFYDKKISESVYPEKIYHRMYIVEITECLVKE
ncbi:MAG: flavin reductase [Clostridia bacterium]|nr:flavin reductase [Clostridia bacterium]